MNSYSELDNCLKMAPSKAILVEEESFRLGQKDALNGAIRRIDAYLEVELLPAGPAGIFQGMLKAMKYEVDAIEADLRATETTRGSSLGDH